ncbi:MAG: hypothetical protein ABFD82_12425 [Syntrophaceae bacterium]
MNTFELISKHFWFIAITVTIINWLIFRKRAQKYIQKNPQLEEGYASLFRGYLFWMNIPWVIMGIGCTFGGVPSVWHYFRPMDGNPYVLAWFGSVFCLWILGTFWLFFRDGAETLVQYPGAIEFRYGLKSKDITNPAVIKALWLLVLPFGIVGVAIMCSIEIPIPTFR